MKRMLWGIIVAIASTIQVCALQTAGKPDPPPQKPPASAQQYSGMYSFLREGEFLQLNVDDAGSVTGSISRYADEQGGAGEFLDQFIKKAKLDGNKLVFTTDAVHGVAFDFEGTVERGDGKAPEDEAYYVLKGRLKESSTDENKKVASKAQAVALRKFPQDQAEAPKK